MSIIAPNPCARCCGSSEPGEPGPPGLSAYEVWLGEGNIGTEQDFLDSLQGSGVNENSLTLGVASQSHVEWAHNLGKYPDLVFLQFNGLDPPVRVVGFQAQYISVNEVHVDFVAPRTGTLVINN